MIYKIDKSLCREFGVFEQNKLSPRAYMIPYTDKAVLEKTSLRQERYCSDKVRVLSGEWDFRFYKSEKDLPDNLNTARLKFGRLPVPGDWQRNGICEPAYLCTPYEFDAELPGMPDDIPVGVYRKIINIEKPAANSIISFLGVANNISLYVNSRFVGYSEGTHNTAEFNIGEFLVPGENEILAVSFKWCTGSYLESQDMFRENGIFRDVLLYEYSGTFIYDYEFTYKNDGEFYSPAVRVSLFGETAGLTVTAELKDDKGNTAAGNSVPAKSETVIELGRIKPRQWSAEIPDVYYLYITLSGIGAGETVRGVTGFKQIKIDGPVFKFNGMPVICKGVNHHDTCLKGYAMTLDDMEEDVRLMKELNVNTVRTSHYPPDPYFLTLADVYGLYVVDEADIEAHGCDELLGDTCYISCNKDWIPYFIDRVKRMYFRDRNHPSLLMWSLGNESGGSLCQDACYDYLRAQGTEIPVHFESVRWKKRFHYDVISEMYTSTESMEKMMQGKRHRDWDPGVDKRVCHEYEKFPYFLCEYCHAMGVGPGNLEEYMDIFYKWEPSMGGCIWEWADHTVYHPPGDKKYKYSYTYGGDHGTKEKGDHFCCDGLVYADRRLHTGAKAMKAAYRPVRSKHTGGKSFRFENTNLFKDTSYIGTQWVMLENGKETARGDFDLCLSPAESRTLELNLPEFDAKKDCHVNFVYTDKETGRNIATEQHALNDAFCVSAQYPEKKDGAITLTAEESKLTVFFENGSCVFDKKAGVMTSYTFRGKEYLAQNAGAPAGFTPSVFRAQTDNDNSFSALWSAAGLDKLKKVCTDFDVTVRGNKAVITVRFELKKEKETLYSSVLSYTVFPDGGITLTAKIEPVSPNAVTDVPCFGVDVSLNADFENIEYYGRGPDENLPDFLSHAPVGIYKTAVHDTFEPYVYPQASGIHCGVKRLSLTDDDGRGLIVVSESPLAFTALPFTQQAIEYAGHIEDLTDMGFVSLSLNGAIRGIGSGSCGPGTRQEYRLDVSRIKPLKIRFIPV